MRSFWFRTRHFNDSADNGNSVGLGSDFDGIGTVPSGLEDVYIAVEKLFNP